MTTDQLTRFLAKLCFIERDEDLGECWEWTALRSTSGYARLAIDGRLKQGHRLSYEHFIGPITDGYEIDHLCRNRACVNPRHLETVTHRVNALRGMMPVINKANAASRTAALRGKPKSAEHRAALSAARRRLQPWLGRKHSIATREKMAESRRAYYARKKAAA